MPIKISRTTFLYLRLCPSSSKLICFANKDFHNIELLLTLLVHFSHIVSSFFPLSIPRKSSLCNTHTLSFGSIPGRKVESSISPLWGWGVGLVALYRSPLLYGSKLVPTPVIVLSTGPLFFHTQSSIHPVRSLVDQWNNTPTNNNNSNKSFPFECVCLRITNFNCVCFRLKLVEPEWKSSAELNGKEHIHIMPAQL